MKKGDKVRVTNACSNFFMEGEIVEYFGTNDLFKNEEHVCSLKTIEYEPLSYFDEIIEELKKMGNFCYIKVFDDYSGAVCNSGLYDGGAFSFSPYGEIKYSDVLSKLKEMNEPKEETINVEGKDLTLKELKQMIKEREAKDAR